MRNEIVLNGTWELAAFDERYGDWSRAESPYPIEASVPGEVHPALQEAGIIPDPYYGTNADAAKWVEGKEWWYRRTFRVPKGFAGSRTYIEFEGLDTYSSVLLNGQPVGSSSDMFIPYRYDVTGSLKEDDENTVEVRFSPAVKVIERMGIDFEKFYIRYNPIRIAARKMQASFGWDWLPRLIGAGIWLPVRLTSYDRLSIHDLHAVPQISDHQAEVRVSFEARNYSAVPLDVRFSATISPDDTEQTQEIDVTIPTAGDTIEFTFTIDDPKLWWPNGMGDQPLYMARIEARSGGEMLDSRETRFGLRTVELRERDADGNPAFTFAINGVPMYAKGANWIPCDGFPSRVTKDRYAQFLSRARDANFNMIRCWGGGIYERPEFYELCDEMGICVWQDFMFSLAEYPDTDDFAGLVDLEVHEVVQRLRSHPSIVLWCGNNECEMDWVPDKVWSGKRLFHEIIPRVVHELDGSRPFWPCSPYGGEKASSAEHGDYHGEPWFHTIRDGIDTLRCWMERDKGLFMSEFPTQGVPEVESLRRFIPEGKLFPPEGPVWDTHIQNNVQREEKIGMNSVDALKKQIDQLMGGYESIEEFALKGGVLQGEFLKYQIDFYRRHKFAVAGSLFWMLDDAWTAVNYSVIDHFARPKPAYYYIKRAFEPVHLVLDAEDDRVGVWVVNDLLEPLKSQVSVSRVVFGEYTRVTASFDVDVEANASTKVFDLPAIEAVTRECYIGRLQAPRGIVSEARRFFAPFKDLLLAEPSLDLERAYLDGTLKLAVTSDQLAFGVHLTGLPDLARPTDNYLDLFPGETREVTVVGLSESEAAQVNVVGGLGLDSDMQQAA